MKAWALAIALHVVVITALVIGFRWPAITGQDTEIIQAVAVEDPKQAQAEKRKREDEARKRQEEEARKREEQARQRKLEQERKRIEAEKQRLTEVRKKEEEARRKAVEERRRKEEQERQRLEAEKQRLAEERQRIEAERQRIAEERKQREEEERKKEVEEQLAAAMAAEERERQEAERRARALTAAEKYKILIRQKVERNWVPPPGTAKDLQCTVKVRLAASGDVLTVAVVRSSGNELFDRSAENAVYKASPLPLPEERDLFDYFREIEFPFKPGA